MTRASSIHPGIASSPSSSATFPVLRRSPGSGLTIDSGVLGIAIHGVANDKLRQSAACSVIGRSTNSTGDVADIAAGANGHVLQREANQLVFRLPKLASYTVAGLPSAATSGAGTIVYCSNARNGGEGAGAGTGSIVASDAVNWKIPGIAGAVTA
jgi:hypothetical protein